MELTKQMLVDMSIGEWIRKNKGKSFAIASPEGVYIYSCEFTENDGKLKGTDCSEITIDDSLTRQRKRKNDYHS